MKVILYAAMSADGKIARGNDDAGFVSKIYIRDFGAMIEKIGNMIVGRRTYEIMQDDGDINYFNDLPMVVVSRRKNIKLVSPAHVVARSPRQAISYLQNQDFKTALVAGGASLNASFTASNLANELYLDLQPKILGNGVPLFRGETFEKKLKLLGVKKTGNGIVLHYRFVK